MRLPYFAEQALETLQGVDLLVTAGTKHPVAFFAYPGKPSELTPEGATRLSLGGPEVSSAAALEALAEALARAGGDQTRRARRNPPRPAGSSRLESVGLYARSPPPRRLHRRR